MSLNVDQPKVGFGNSSDENTLRRAFENFDIFFVMTGVNIEVKKGMHIVLITISSGYLIDTNQFEFYCTISKTIVSKYGWYIITPGINKILIHAQESLNKQI